MKMPEIQKPKLSVFNTLTLTGLSVLWATMLGLIPAPWAILSGVLLLSGYGHEIRTNNER